MTALVRLCRREPLGVLPRVLRLCRVLCPRSASQLAHPMSDPSTSASLSIFYPFLGSLTRRYVTTPVLTAYATYVYRPDLHVPALGRYPSAGRFHTEPVLYSIGSPRPRPCDIIVLRFPRLLFACSVNVGSENQLLRS